MRDNNGVLRRCAGNQDSVKRVHPRRATFSASRGTVQHCNAAAHAARRQATRKRSGGAKIYSVRGTKRSAQVPVTMPRRVVVHASTRRPTHAKENHASVTVRTATTPRNRLQYSVVPANGTANGMRTTQTATKRFAFSKTRWRARTRQRKSSETVHCKKVQREPQTRAMRRRVRCWK